MRRPSCCPPAPSARRFLQVAAGAVVLHCIGVRPAHHVRIGVEPALLAQLRPRLGQRLRVRLRLQARESPCVRMTSIDWLPISPISCTCLRRFCSFSLLKIGLMLPSLTRAASRFSSQQPHLARVQGSRVSPLPFQSALPQFKPA